MSATIPERHYFRRAAINHDYCACGLHSGDAIHIWGPPDAECPPLEIFAKIRAIADFPRGCDQAEALDRLESIFHLANEVAGVAR